MGPEPITIRFCRIWMGAWTSIYQQFWCSARYQGFDPADVSNLGGIFEYSVVLETTQHWMISLGLEETRISVMYPPRIAVQNWDMLISKALEIYRGVSHGYPTSWTPTGKQVAERPWWPSWLLSLEKSRRFCGGFEHVNDRNMKIMIGISITAMIMWLSHIYILSYHHN